MPTLLACPRILLVKRFHPGQRLTARILRRNVYTLLKIDLHFATGRDHLTPPGA
jgi:hypothetical protein